MHPEEDVVASGSDIFPRLNVKLPAVIVSPPPVIVKAVPALGVVMVTAPAGLMEILPFPAVLSTRVLTLKVDRPVVVLPVKFREGPAALPTGSRNAPVMVSPDFNT